MIDWIFVCPTVNCYNTVLSSHFPDKNNLVSKPWRGVGNLKRVKWNVNYRRNLTSSKQKSWRVETLKQDANYYCGDCNMYLTNVSYPGFKSQHIKIQAKAYRIISNNCFNQLIVFTAQSFIYYRIKTLSCFPWAEISPDTVHLSQKTPRLYLFLKSWLRYFLLKWGFLP